MSISAIAPAPLVAFGSGKGGTGKSTACLAIAAHLASSRGEPVAVVDLDPQAGLTDYAGLEPALDPLTADPVDVHGLTLYRGGRALAQASTDQIAQLLTRAMAPGYPVLADLSPAWSDTAHRAALAVPGMALVLAVKLDSGGIRGARELTALAERGGVPFRIVPTFEKRWVVAVAIQQSLRAFYRDMVTTAAIPEDVKAAEAVAARLPVTLYAPKSRAAQAIAGVTDELFGAVAAHV